MNGEAFAAWSPLEVGDTVRMKDVAQFGPESIVTDILTIHRARRNDVTICYELDGRRVVPLRFIRCRVSHGEEVPIGEERFKSEEVKR